jgi:hypothetical protein
MNAIKRHLGLLASGAIVAASVWACTATRHPDGTMTLEFSPDKTVRTKGLEDALRLLNDLMAGCIQGTFSTPCTQEEMDDITAVTKWVLREKRKIDRSGPVVTG